MTPADFIAKWGPGGPASDLNERQGAQPYFMDLCALLAVPTPGSQGDYLFEQDALLLGAARGYADVFLRNHFAWENKAPGKNLDTALKQLLTYSLALANPPLLVVCDRLVIRIHTQFNGHPSEVHTIVLAQLADPAVRDKLRWLWNEPERFRPKKTSRAITEEAAHSFAKLAEQLRGRGHAPNRVSHFLTQCLFCFFAEDVGLLPGRMFERMVDNKKITSDVLTQGLANLFNTMRDGGLYGADSIPWFNGGLFATIDVPKLEIVDITELRNAAGLDWSAIDVSIFGTLFERGLDPAKRSQLGAHYTDPVTIDRIIQPVIARPLRAEWELVRSAMAKDLAKSKKHGDAAHKKARTAFLQWLERLRAYRALDPACGSGNFLFMALKTLKDIEHLSHTQAGELLQDRETDLVTGPHNLLGIEINEYAAELARVTVWIGELQWRLEHGYPFKDNPVLEALEHIECRDALLNADGSEAVWPEADAVVGNPPFLGTKKQWTQLGVEYSEMLRAAYSSSVPGFSDLVCYWFEKARAAMVSGRLQIAGLVATNSIRGGANRVVLDRIARDLAIFEAWSDEEWVNDGAAVRVSMLAFAPRGFSGELKLNGKVASAINADLHQGAMTYTAVKLPSNVSCCFIATVKAGSFDLKPSVARDYLFSPNVHGRSNSDVVKRWVNGIDVVRRMGDQWVVDFGVDMEESDAAMYELPFAHVKAYVLPERQKTRAERERRLWWLMARPIPGMRRAVAPLRRQLVTVNVSKYRLFCWMPTAYLADHALSVIARADDATFGILHSRVHEIWSLRMGTSLEDRPRYTPTTCFETYPFPTGLTPADTAHQQTETLDDGAQIPAHLTGPLREAAARIARAAHRLDTLRQGWLNPPEWTHRVPEVVPLGMDASPYPDRIEPKPGLGEQALKQLRDRTLTKLYNQRPQWLATAHAELDAAVAAAYALTDTAGAAFWAGCDTATPDDVILARLLALNLQRAAVA